MEEGQGPPGSAPSPSSRLEASHFWVPLLLFLTQVENLLRVSPPLQSVEGRPEVWVAAKGPVFSASLPPAQESSLFCGPGAPGPACGLLWVQTPVCPGSPSAHCILDKSPGPLPPSGQPTSAPSCCAGSLPCLGAWPGLLFPGVLIVGGGPRRAPPLPAPAGHSPGCPAWRRKAGLLYCPVECALGLGPPVMGPARTWGLGTLLERR